MIMNVGEKGDVTFSVFVADNPSLDRCAVVRVADLVVGTNRIEVTLTAWEVAQIVAGLTGCFFQAIERVDERATSAIADAGRTLRGMANHG